VKQVHERIADKTYPSLQRIPILIPQLLEPILLLLSQIRELLHLCLIQSIDDRILAFLNMYPLDLRKTRQPPLQQNIPSLVD
jgi:hypothetical protein